MYFYEHEDLFWINGDWQRISIWSVSKSCFRVNSGFVDTRDVQNNISFVIIFSLRNLTSLEVRWDSQFIILTSVNWDEILISKFSFQWSEMRNIFQNLTLIFGIDKKIQKLFIQHMTTVWTKSAFFIWTTIFEYLKYGYRYPRTA